MQPNTVITSEELLTQVWGAEFVGEPQVVYVHIRWLREKQELIFEPFYRSTQRQRIKQGMGLGLSIVRDLVNAQEVYWN